MALESHSIRVGVAVRLVVRLFAASVEADKSIRPTVGPAAVEPGDPTVVELESPGDPNYRRVWRIAPPSKGASRVADPSRDAGFEDSPDPTPKPVLELEELDDVGADANGPALGGDPGDEHVVLATVLARSVKLKLGPHRQADECELELPIEAFPFPPDGSIVRSILVEVRRGVISPDDWAAAMGGRRARDGRPLTLPVATDSDQPDFVGFVDTHRIQFGDGASVVSLKARGIQGVLLDSQVRGRKIENDIPVDRAVARFLSLFPAAVGLELHWLGPEKPPTLGDAAPKAKTTKAGKPVKPPAKAEKGSAYDAIADYCLLAGVIPRFVGYRLELGAARTLDTFSAAEAPRIVLGRSVDDLELEHKLAGTTAKAVEVHSFNPDTGRIVVGRWPEDPNLHGEKEPGEANKVAPTGPLNIPPGASAVEEKSPTVMTVRGIKDPRRLQEIARNLFEESARQEIGGRLKTRDLATYDGRASGVADLLAMRPGDPIRILIAPSVEAAAGSYVQRLARLGDRGKAIELLAGAGWRRTVAARVVDGILSAKRPLTYRVRALSFEHSMEGGTSTEIEFVNYIEVIDEVTMGPIPPGGNRARVALDPTASWGDKWTAIDADALAGEITLEKADELKRQAGDVERRRRRELEVRPIREEF